MSFDLKTKMWPRRTKCPNALYTTYTNLCSPNEYEKNYKIILEYFQ